MALDLDDPKEIKESGRVITLYPAEELPITNKY